MSLENGQTTEQAPLGFTLAAAARKLAKFYAAALAGGPVTPSQLFFLRQLWSEDGLSLVTLRERAQLDATSASWLADQLEKAGLIERRRNAPDRRIVRIWLTGDGRSLREDLSPQIERWEGSLRETLAIHHRPDEIDAFERVLKTLIVTLPEGDDLWAELSAAWDTTLDALRHYLEAEEH
ncbi:MAG TPA: MarR family transcriptional regulator [Thermomicrobiales bacterium]|nr:MarR family transcriptional regulator [Thermomicrobiales bacterium]